MRPNLVGVAFVLLVLLVGGGCTKRGAAPSDVSLLLRVSPEQLPAWQAAIDEFSKASKLTVAVDNVPGDDYYSKLEAGVARGKGPDVVFIESTRFPECVAKGLLTPLNSNLKGQTDIVPTDFVPAAWAAYEHQGVPYGLPHEVQTLAVAFNRNEFEVNNLRDPDDKWTWADFLKDAQELTRDQDGDGRTDVWGTTLFPWWQVMAWQNGGEIVDDSQNPQRSTTATPAVQEALQYLADLHQQHHVTPRYDIAMSMGRLKGFANGHLGMVVAGRWELAAIATMQDRWGVADLPRGRQPANLGTGTCFALAKGAPHAEAGWRLMRFLAGGDGQALLLAGGTSTPARKALLASEAFVNNLTGGPQSPYAKALAVIHPMPYTPRYGEIAKVWDKELEALWTGKATVQEVTQRIDEQVTKLLAQSQPTTAWLLPVSNPRL